MTCAAAPPTSLAGLGPGQGSSLQMQWQEGPCLHDQCLEGPDVPKIIKTILLRLIKKFVMLDANRPTNDTTTKILERRFYTDRFVSCGHSNLLKLVPQDNMHAYANLYLTQPHVTGHRQAYTVNYIGYACGTWFHEFVGGHHGRSNF